MSSKLKYSKKISRLDDSSADPLAGDLSEFIAAGGWQSVSFELTEKKDKVLSIRLSEKLLTELKKQAQKSGLDTQKFVRIILESSLRKKTG